MARLRNRENSVTEILIAHAIGAALSSAALAGASDTAKKAIGDAYEGLKSLIKRKLGDSSPVSQAVGSLESKPDSAGRTQTLTEELQSVNAASDPEIAGAAQSLLKLLEALPSAPQFNLTASGTGIAQAAGGSSASVNMYGTWPAPDVPPKTSGPKTQPDD